MRDLVSERKQRFLSCTSNVFVIDEQHSVISEELFGIIKKFCTQKLSVVCMEKLSTLNQLSKNIDVI